MKENMLSVEQMARELFVSTETIRAWIDKGEIVADKKEKSSYYFSPEKVKTIIGKKGLKEHTSATIKKDFFEFLEKRNYTFSYKIVFLLSFLKVLNERGEADLPSLFDKYKIFYENLLLQHNKNEKKHSPYNRKEFLGDEKKLKQNLLKNPFEKFERKGFLSKNSNFISFNLGLWKRLKKKEITKIQIQMVDDLKVYYNKQQINIVKDDYSFLI